CPGRSGSSSPASRGPVPADTSLAASGDQVYPGRPGGANPNKIHAAQPRRRASGRQVPKLGTMAKTPDEMMGAVSASLAERTGKTMEQWVALVRASGIDPLDQNAVRRWLRTEHGVPQNSQWAIADAAARAAGWVRPSTAEYIDSQYTGAKAALRPIYDALASAIMGLGEDVRVEGPGGCTPS